MSLRMMARVAAMASALSLALLACGDDDDGRCVATLCDRVSHGAVCVGQRVQTCANDGKRFDYRECGVQERCDEVSGGCVARTCTTLGQATCASVTEVQRCRDDGSGFDRTPCGAGEVCRDGACVPASCTREADRCSTNGVLACQEGAWVQANCPVGQVCAVGDNDLARCQAPLCAPQSRRCANDTTALACDARGTVETVIRCDNNEVCLAGVCQREVCGSGGAADVSDASETGDGGGETEVSEPDSRIVFTLNGQVQTFDISALATFDAGRREVRVRASKATRWLELRLSPANMTIQGTFSSEIFNPVKVVVCYADGGRAASFAECEGATHRAVAYDLVVSRNDGQGGRFEASFAATLEDVNTDTSQLSAGQINVRYR
jgi:hypothetical protein